MLPLLGLFQNVFITNGISIVLQNDTKDINSFAKWYKRHKNKRAQLIGSLLLTFLQKKLSRYIGKPKIRRRSQVWAGLGAKICAQAAARVKIQQYCFLILCLHFIGIDKIAGRFTSKVDDRKSSKIQFISSMLQKAPKRRSPNPYNYKLKWTETVIVPEIRSKCNKFRKSNLTVSSKCYSSEYAIFPQRQP